MWKIVPSWRNVISVSSEKYSFSSSTTASGDRRSAMLVKPRRSANSTTGVRTQVCAGEQGVAEVAVFENAIRQSRREITAEHLAQIIAAANLFAQLARGDSRRVALARTRVSMRAWSSSRLTSPETKSSAPAASAATRSREDQAEDHDGQQHCTRVLLERPAQHEGRLGRIRVHEDHVGRELIDATDGLLRRLNFADDEGPIGVVGGVGRQGRRTRTGGDDSNWKLSDGHVGRLPLVAGSVPLEVKKVWLRKFRQAWLHRKHGRRHEGLAGAGWSDGRATP